jgi:hypothetical protein
MLTGAGIGRRWGKAARPPRNRGGSAELQCAAAAARVRGASVGWGSEACAGANYGPERELGVRARAGAEITAVIVVCGGSGSCTTAPRDIGSGGGTSRKKGGLGRRPGCGLECGAEDRPQGAEARPGGRSAEQRAA